MAETMRPATAPLLEFPQAPRCKRRATLYHHRFELDAERSDFKDVIRHFAVRRRITVFDLIRLTR